MRCAEHPLDVVDGVVQRDMLPKADNLPTRVLKPLGIETITLGVPCELRAPVGRIGERGLSVNRAPMPEAAIYKYSYAATREHQVRTSSAASDGHG